MTEPINNTLAGRVVALAETRQLDVLADLLERRGAVALRCPLVAILDAPDPRPVQAWLEQFIQDPGDDLILLTGEGLRRLLGVAERAGVKESFIAALGRVRKIVRGPKPARALREIGLKAEVSAEQPTTDGVIATLDKQALQDRGISVQLYGTDPNRKLIEYLGKRGARVRSVAPYVYASAADDARVSDLIRQMAQGKIDAIAFTSQPQYRRLRDVAKAHDLEAPLAQGLARVKVAAVGPVVAEALKRSGVRVDLMPSESYFMKPLVNELVTAFGNNN